MTEEMRRTNRKMAKGNIQQTWRIERIPKKLDNYHCLHNQKEKLQLATITGQYAYAAESWILVEKYRSKITSSERKYLRRMMCTSRRYRIKNRSIREEISLTSSGRGRRQSTLTIWTSYLHKNREGEIL